MRISSVLPIVVERDLCKHRGRVLAPPSVEGVDPSFSEAVVRVDAFPLHTDAEEAKGCDSDTACRSKTALATVTAVLVSGGIAAATSGSEGTITACVDRDGDVRIVHRASDCSRKESAVAWNQARPRGRARAGGREGRDGRQGFGGPGGLGGRRGAGGPCGRCRVEGPRRRSEGRGRRCGAAVGPGGPRGCGRSEGREGRLRLGPAQLHRCLGRDGPRPAPRRRRRGRAQRPRATSAATSTATTARART